MLAYPLGPGSRSRPATQLARSGDDKRKSSSWPSPPIPAAATAAPSASRSTPTSEGTLKCNCSSCTKARSWYVFASADRFRLTTGADAQANYRWVPPGRTEPTVEFHFCRTCGIRTPGRGDLEAMGGVFYAVQIALLDDIDRRRWRPGPDPVRGRPGHRSFRSASGRHPLPLGSSVSRPRRRQVARPDVDQAAFGRIKRPTWLR